jgi:UDP-N-acetylmuramyl pentapeptide phosphotransferase/UDP-N-acetylglucosamine-1-phosphate transferase
MGLGVLLAVVAFLTNSVFLLIFIGFIFALEASSVLLQLFWKKYFKKKNLPRASSRENFHPIHIMQCYVHGIPRKKWGFQNREQQCF